MANVVIMTTGTNGDIAPFVGLGAGLRALGHEVSIAANDSAGPMVAAAGLPFHGLPGPDLSVVAASSVGEAAARPGIRGTRSLVKTAAAAMREPVPAMIAAASGQDAILCTPSTVLLAAPIAEANRIPCAVLALQPITPTREFSSIALGGRNLGRFANKTSASLLGRVGVRMFASTVRALREDLGLNARPGKGCAPADLAVLYGISTAVLTRPRDYPPAVDFAGYWWPRSMSQWTPSAELLRFLDDGPTPIYIGFGSAGASRGAELSAIITDGAGTQRAPCRCPAGLGRSHHLHPKGHRRRRDPARMAVPQSGSRRSPLRGRHDSHRPAVRPAGRTRALRPGPALLGPSPPGTRNRPSRPSRQKASSRPIGRRAHHRDDQLHLR